MAKKIKILSIDGGGIRGIIPAVLLDQLEKRMGKPIAQLFDLIAGTSTGGILALAVARPAGKAAPQNTQPYYSAADMIALYEREGARIFSRSPWRTVRSLGGILDELYPTEGIESVLREYFGETRLSEALTDVLVPSYEIEQREPLFFKSWKAKLNAEDDFFMWQAARATSAAPTYFEPTQIKTADRTYTLVDGGVIVNNPAMSAYAEAMRIYPEATEFMIVSLGTGDPTRPIHYAEAKNWGAPQWVVPLFSVFIDGSSSAVDYQLRQTFPRVLGKPKSYYRFQSLLSMGNDNIDDASHTNISVLKILADNLLDNIESDLAEICMQLKE